MARRNTGMTAAETRGPKIGLVVSTALASLALAGCAGAAPPAEVSFSKAQAALEDGRVDRAITHAEAAVLAEPRNASFRALLGAAYLEAGRFQSAATSFGDAIELGDSDPRTVLSYALAQTALGNNAEAIEMLSAHEEFIPAADLGLAFSLAGQPERGVHYLIESVRNGNSSAKARQNLAYSYALAGNWRAARVMAAEDVPADQLDARLTSWAETSRPEDYQVRVANLLGVNATSDTGQPQMLALANFPSQPTLVEEAAQMADASDVVDADVGAEPSESEAMAFAVREDAEEPVETVDPTVQSILAATSPQTAVASAPAPTPVAAPSPAATSSARVPAAAAPARSAPRFVSNAVVQAVPAVSEERPAPRPAARPATQRRMAVASGSAATHLVQLGAFSSRAVAEAKWEELQRRFPDLAGRDVVITEAVVNGRTYFRVAAVGFSSRSARSMCGTVRSSGAGCFAYAASSPPAGAVDRGVRVAARSR